MNLKAIIASLVLGTSSIAMAAPGVTVTAAARPTYTTLPAAWNAPAQPSYEGRYRHGGFRAPVTLASDLRFARDGRTFITVGNQLGRFGALQLNASLGRTYIQQVYVQFENGQEQVIRDVNRTLSGRETLTLDLDGGRRAIKRIVVYGNDLNRGWRRAPGAFTVTAV